MLASTHWNCILFGRFVHCSLPFMLIFTQAKKINMVLWNKRKAVCYREGKSTIGESHNFVPVTLICWCAYQWQACLGQTNFCSKLSWSVWRLCTVDTCWRDRTSTDHKMTDKHIVPATPGFASCQMYWKPLNIHCVRYKTINTNKLIKTFKNTENVRRIFKSMKANLINSKIIC